jgi:hypothetical protein
MCRSNQPSKSEKISQIGDKACPGISEVAAQSARLDGEIANGSTHRIVLDDFNKNLLQKCQKISRIRRARERIFEGSDIFCDPAWDIMLDLFSGHLQGRQTSVTSAGLAGYAPITTALRWLAILEKQGFVQREYDPADRRRMFVSLTEPAIASMIKILEEI